MKASPAEWVGESNRRIVSSRTTHDNINHITAALKEWIGAIGRTATALVQCLPRGAKSSRVSPPNESISNRICTVGMHNQHGIDPSTNYGIPSHTNWFDLIWFDNTFWFLTIGGQCVPSSGSGARHFPRFAFIFHDQRWTHRKLLSPAFWPRLNHCNTTSTSVFDFWWLIRWLCRDYKILLVWPLTRIPDTLTWTNKDSFLHSFIRILCCSWARQRFN